MADNEPWVIVAGDIGTVKVKGRQWAKEGDLSKVSLYVDRETAKDMIKYLRPLTDVQRIELSTLIAMRLSDGAALNRELTVKSLFLAGNSKAALAIEPAVQKEKEEP